MQTFDTLLGIPMQDSVVYCGWKNILLVEGEKVVPKVTSTCSLSIASLFSVKRIFSIYDCRTLRTQF